MTVLLKAHALRMILITEIEEAARAVFVQKTGCSSSATPGEVRGQENGSSC